MVNAISSTTPQTNNIKAMDKVSQEKLYSRGPYTVEELLGIPPARKKRERSGFLMFLFETGLLVTGIGIAAGIARAKTNFSKFPVHEKPASLLEQGKYYLAKFGDFVNTKVVKKITSLFSKTEPEPVPVNGSGAAAAAEDAAKTT